MRFGDASTSLATSTDTTMDETLQDDVCEVVDELKALGWPPERAIIAIKQIAEEAGLSHSQRVLMKNHELGARDALVAKVMRWTIECYYDTTRVA